MTEGRTSTSRHAWTLGSVFFRSTRPQSSYIAQAGFVGWNVDNTLHSLHTPMLSTFQSRVISGQNDSSWWMPYAGGSITHRVLYLVGFQFERLKCVESLVNGMHKSARQDSKYIRTHKRDV
ncbi:hypothetical protein AcW1_006836 [Taiwanofungus camphoratus]|nr:hypothetical protein AcW1_006836 [Antrodia cinnamomea]